MRALRLVLASLVGYLLGTVPSADVATRVATGGRVDLRRSGSRNPGAMNVARVVGRTTGRVVMVADVAKGFASCACGRAVAGDTGAHVAGAAAVLGHCYPLWKGFRGGKGIATSFGQCLHTFPVAAPVELALVIGVARLPGLRRPGLSATLAASGAWVLLSVVWWRRRLPNSWGPAPTAALPLATGATVLIVASRSASAYLRGDPDEMELPAA